MHPMQETDWGIGLPMDQYETYVFPLSPGVCHGRFLADLYTKL